MLENLIENLIQYYEKKGKKLTSDFLKYSKDENLIFQYTLWLDDKKITIATFGIPKKDYQESAERSIKLKLIITTINNLNIMAINTLENK